MSKEKYRGLLSIACLFISSALCGCAYQAIERNGRIERNPFYSIGVPADGWKNVTDNLSFSQKLTYKAFFGHCPHLQAMWLMDIYLADSAPLSQMKHLLPSEIDPGSFEGRALYYLESKRFFERDVSSEAYHLMSVSTGSISGNISLDAVYTERTVGFTSCGAQQKAPNMYKKRFVFIDKPKRSFPILFGRPDMVLIMYSSPESAYEEHVSDFEKWVATFRVK